MGESILIAGRSFCKADIPSLPAASAWQEELAAFLEEWFSPGPVMRVQTSGSTGEPKVMLAEKKRMEASARMTCSFLGLKAGDSALLCMPVKYIGARMMVVRALVQGLDLYCVKPSSHPLRDLGFAPGFLAVTPAQVFTMLDNGDEEALLRSTEHIIIGGGAVDAGLAERLGSFPRHVWSTYGMTETLSHIALRRLNGPQRSAFYTPFPGVSLSLSPESTLVIRAPAVAEDPVVTNDFAELREDGSFRILGRKDNVINSGGIKIQIEAVEEQLRSFLPFAFCITAVPDEHYGEIVVMLAAFGPDKTEREALERGLAVLHAYSRPKRVIAVPDLPRTGSGKIDRAGARAIAQKLAGGAHA